METVYKLYNMLFTKCTRAEYNSISTYNEKTQYIVTETDGKISLYLGTRPLVSESSAEFTPAEKTKLAGIQAGAEVNVQADWNVTDSSSDAYIKNKPNVVKLNSSGSIVLDAGDKYIETRKNTTFPSQVKNGSTWEDNYTITDHNLLANYINTGATPQAWINNKYKYDFFQTNLYNEENLTILDNLISKKWISCISQTRSFLLAGGDYEGRNLCTQTAIRVIPSTVYSITGEQVSSSENTYVATAHTQDIRNTNGTNANPSLNVDSTTHTATIGTSSHYTGQISGTVIPLTPKSVVVTIDGVPYADNGLGTIQFPKRTGDTDFPIINVDYITGKITNIPSSYTTLNISWSYKNASEYYYRGDTILNRDQIKRTDVFAFTMGSIGSEDIDKIENIIAGTYAPTNEEFLKYDLDQNGVIDATDLKYAKFIEYPVDTTFDFSVPGTREGETSRVTGPWTQLYSQKTLALGSSYNSKLPRQTSYRANILTKSLVFYYLNGYDENISTFQNVNIYSDLILDNENLRITNAYTDNLITKVPGTVQSKSVNNTVYHRSYSATIETPSLVTGTELKFDFGQAYSAVVYGVVGENSSPSSIAPYNINCGISYTGNTRSIQGVGCAFSSNSTFYHVCIEIKFNADSTSLDCKKVTAINSKVFKVDSNGVLEEINNPYLTILDIRGIG